jgi:hypothetical protein
MRYLQFLPYKMGELDKALAVHSLIRKLYKPEIHSKGLCRFYGMDSGALSFNGLLFPPSPGRK